MSDGGKNKKEREIYYKNKKRGIPSLFEIVNYPDL